MRRALLVTALLACSVDAKKKTKKKKRRATSAAAVEKTETERLCDMCMGLAEHCTGAVSEIVKRGKAERDQKALEGQGINWDDIVVRGCHGEALCENTLIGDVTRAIAEELENMVDDIEESETEFDHRVLPNLICAPDSITRACPKKLYKEPDAGMEAMRPFSVALWNGRTVDSKTMGDVEVHLVRPKDLFERCAPSETVKGEARFADRNVRKLGANEEQMFSLAVSALNPTVPTLRIKKLGAPCGMGVDLDVDLAEDKWAVFEVVDNKKHDPKKPSTTINGVDNRPLLVRKLPDRDARAMLEKDHPYWDEL